MDGVVLRQRGGAAWSWGRREAAGDTAGPGDGSTASGPATADLGNAIWIGAGGPDAADAGPIDCPTSDAG